MTKTLAVVAVLCPFNAPAQSQSPPQGFTIQGRILKSDGVPVEATSVLFRVQIRSPGVENCLLYQESHVVPMGDSDGVFALSVGSGTREASALPQHTSSLSQSLSNTSTIPGTLECVAPATTYTPLANHGRRVEVSFDDGTGFQTVSQAIRLNSVPYSMYAETLQGRAPSDFINRNSTSAALTQSNLEGVFASTAYVNELIALIAGNSAQYVKANGAGFVPTAAVSYNNQRITNLSNPTAAQDAATKDYADKQIGGKIVDVTITNLAAGDSGKVLSWDGSKWVASTVSTTDATKLPLAGGTMTGAITMGGNNLLQTGHITMNPGRYLHLGTYDNSAEATLIGSLTGAHKGAIWYNTTDNVIKHWNGSAVIASGPIADNAVTTPKIADGAVTTPKLLANPGINRIVATDGTLGSTLAPMTCATVGHVLKWTMANGFQCAADDGGQWTTSGSNISFASGNVGIGTSTPSAALTIDGTNYPSSSLISISRSSTVGFGPGLDFYRSEGATGVPSSQTLSGRYLGQINFRGTDQNGNQSASSAAARLSAVTEEAVTTTSSGGGLAFLTSNLGSISPTEKMRLSSSGNLGVGVTSPSARIHLAPGTSAAGTAPLKFNSGTN